MKISIKRSDELTFMDLTPETEAESFQLEALKKACFEAKIINSEKLRIFLLCAPNMDNATEAQYKINE